MRIITASLFGFILGLIACSNDGIKPIFAGNVIHPSVGPHLVRYAPAKVPDGETVPSTKELSKPKEILVDLKSAYQAYDDFLKKYVRDGQLQLEAAAAEEVTGLNGFIYYLKHYADFAKLNKKSPPAAQALVVNAYNATQIAERLGYPQAGVPLHGFNDKGLASYAELDTWLSQNAPNETLFATLGWQRLQVDTQALHCEVEALLTFEPALLNHPYGIDPAKWQTDLDQAKKDYGQRPPSQPLSLQNGGKLQLVSPLIERYFKAKPDLQKNISEFSPQHILAPDHLTLQTLGENMVAVKATSVFGAEQLFGIAELGDGLLVEFAGELASQGPFTIVLAEHGYMALGNERIIASHELTADAFPATVLYRVHRLTLPSETLQADIATLVAHHGGTPTVVVQLIAHNADLSQSMLHECDRQFTTLFHYAEGRMLFIQLNAEHAEDFLKLSSDPGYQQQILNHLQTDYAASPLVLGFSTNQDGSLAQWVGHVCDCYHLSNNRAVALQSFLAYL